MSGAAPELPLHADARGEVGAAPPEVFDYVDRPERLSAHMARPTWRMPGGTMRIDTDEGGGRRVGSRIRLAGRVLGMPLMVDGEVVARDPPHYKAWATVGEPRLLVIGSYRMRVTIDARGDGSRVAIAIDYALPARRWERWLGALLGGAYARWCVDQMLTDLQAKFASRTLH